MRTIVTLDRLWIALPLSIAGMMSSVSSDVSSACSVFAVPSRFDYLVLASMADSQHPISMASYRPENPQKKPCNSSSTNC
jgi:hypothetical protein